MSIQKIHLLQEADLTTPLLPKANSKVGLTASKVNWIVGMLFVAGLATLLGVLGCYNFDLHQINSWELGVMIGGDALLLATLVYRLARKYLCSPTSDPLPRYFRKLKSNDEEMQAWESRSQARRILNKSLKERAQLKGSKIMKGGKSLAKVRLSGVAKADAKKDKEETIKRVAEHRRAQTDLRLLIPSDNNVRKRVGEMFQTGRAQWTSQEKECAIARMSKDLDRMVFLKGGQPLMIESRAMKPFKDRIKKEIIGLDQRAQEIILNSIIPENMQSYRDLIHVIQRNLERAGIDVEADAFTQLRTLYINEFIKPALDEITGNDNPAVYNHNELLMIALMGQSTAIAGKNYHQKLYGTEVAFRQGETTYINIGKDKEGNPFVQTYDELRPSVNMSTDPQRKLTFEVNETTHFHIHHMDPLLTTVKLNRSDLRRSTFHVETSRVAYGRDREPQASQFLTRDYA